MASRHRELEEQVFDIDKRIKDLQQRRDLCRQDQRLLEEKFRELLVQRGVSTFGVNMGDGTVCIVNSVGDLSANLTFIPIFG